MNCKPGDLAYVVGSRTNPEINGAIVEVIELYEVDSWLVRGRAVEEISRKWRVPPHVRDSMLRPIRDNDGEDQTLTWAGKPSDIKTPEAA